MEFTHSQISQKLSEEYAIDFTYDKKTRKFISKDPPKCGNVYLVHGDVLCLLSQVAYNEIALISLDNSGNRWNEPVKVEYLSAIKNEEFEKCLCGFEAKLVGTINDFLKKDVISE